mmetsp:Transcript_97070/g.259346  ORF Transcript_97070/g.259346 Transcript_97070/m.259346 type:complete len:290 (+) Transcript_97070:88-957(+)
MRGPSPVKWRRFFCDAEEGGHRGGGHPSLEERQLLANVMGMGMSDMEVSQLQTHLEAHLTMLAATRHYGQHGMREAELMNIMQYGNPHLDPFGESDAPYPSSMEIDYAMATPPGDHRPPWEKQATVILDKTVLYLKTRWIAFAVAISLFCARVILMRGWYVVAYGLFVYLLKLFVAFISPARDPVFEEVCQDGSDEEDTFRPFVRRLPEFEFWTASMRAVLIALLLSMFRALDMQIFWPILVLYFFVLFFATMKEQVTHMLQYGYVPWSTGRKKTYTKVSKAEPELQDV